MNDEPSYTPAPDELQLTFRAVAAGCVLGAMVCAMNIYFGLKTGWSIGGSLIAAILSFALFSAVRSAFPAVPRFSTLETNIAQTAGSAAGSMTSAAGLLSAIPAMGMLGFELGYLELTLWAASVAWLGVFYAVPLRRQMVVVEKLRFPTGTATAATIVAMFSEGGDAVRKARYLLGFGLLAGVFTLGTYFVTPLSHPPLETWIGGAVLVGLATYGFSLLLSPLMTGAGILIGPRVGASLLVGAILGWGVLAPWVESQGYVTGATMSYADGARGWILWPGVAIMVADALTSLALSWRTILATFRRPGDDPNAVDNASIRDQIPNAWWMGGLAVATVFTVIVAWRLFEIPWWMTLLAVALSSVLAMIAVRSTGETDINPIGGMGKITQVVYGAIAPGSMSTNLMAAAITGSGASQAGDMMQDLKTGYLLGASPRKQLIAQLAGITAGILICVPIYIVFDQAYEIGIDPNVPAPAAHAWKAMAEVLSKGLEALPQHATFAVLGGLLFGIAMPVIRSVMPDSVKHWVPSGLAVGIAFIVPAYYSVAMFLGAMLYQLWMAFDRDSANALGFAVASGLVAGEGLMGVVNAFLELANVPKLM